MLKATQIVRLLACTALISGGFAASALAQAQHEGEAQIDTLTEAVSIGVETNPSSGVVENNRRATAEELEQARALYLPSVDAQGDTGIESTDNVNTRAGGDDWRTLKRYQFGVTLTQMLFDGFETHYENERQTQRVRSAAHRVRENSEFTGLDIVEAYLDVVRQRELLKIARDNVAQHVDIMRQIEDGASAGRSTEADVEQVRARLAAARANEANVTESLRTAEAAFNQQVGDMPGNLKVPVAPIDRLEENVDEEVKQTLTHSPTLDIYEADVNVAEAEYKGTRSTYYPQFDLQLQGQQGNDLGGIEGNERSASALVLMNWNLFRGGGDKARERELVYRHAQAKEQRNDAARSVENDVRQTWASMVSAKERAKQFTEQASANEQVVLAYKDQFDLDRRTLLDVLDAQNELFVSRSNTINNQILEMFAIYRLLALKGDLLPALDVAYQAEVDPQD